ncbi:MAG: FAD:protein FMN transferase [Candidatus Magasanikbacteria bacterium]|nr:FAD:protein FMN transferase [Candidatus Magasanikbacteria bacterium]
MAETTWKFEAIGTHWQIDLSSKNENVNLDSLFKLTKQRIEEFERNYSRFRSDSLFTKMSKDSGIYTLPEDAKPLFDLYEKLYKLTDGAFTPLIGQTLSDAGYDAAYSLTPKKIQPPPSWIDTIEYNFPTLTLHKPALLDVGAAGKGYLVDIVASILDKHGITSYCVDAGGDIVYKTDSNKTLSIGLENPKNFDEVIGVAHIKNQSICGSSGSRRKWKNFHHTINPHTLESPKDTLAVWVVADSGLLADTLTTCLSFVDAQKLTTTYSFEYVLLKSDMSCVKSVNFPGEIFTS